MEYVTQFKLCFFEKREKSSLTLISLRCRIIRFLPSLNRRIDLLSGDLFNGDEFYPKRTSGVEITRWRLDLNLVRQKIFVFLLELYQRSSIRQEFPSYNVPGKMSLGRCPRMKCCWEIVLCIEMYCWMVSVP